MGIKAVVVSWVGRGQRVLNELYRARLSRSRMIWLLAHPLSRQ
jgi:hypothetical protein